MYNWFVDLIHAPSGFEDQLVSGTILCAIACVIFLFWLLSRLFR